MIHDIFFGVDAVMKICGSHEEVKGKDECLRACVYATINVPALIFDLIPYYLYNKVADE